MSSQSEINRAALIKELRVAAAPPRDDCSGSPGHYFTKVYPENRWQCINCPETRERNGGTS